MWVCVPWWPAGYLVLALVLACGAHGGGGVISGFWGVFCWYWRGIWFGLGDERWAVIVWGLVNFFFSCVGTELDLQLINAMVIIIIAHHFTCGERKIL